MPNLEVVAQPLPIELFANIIDCLSGDPKSLGSCALVCRSWRSFAQANLFNKLTLHERYTDTAERISCLVNGATIHCLYVETLCFPNNHWFYDFEEIIDVNTIGLLVRNLPHLKSLEIDILLRCDVQDRTSVTPTLSLDKVSIMHQSFNLKSIHHLLMLFSSIKHVSIESYDRSLKIPQDLPILHHLRVASLSLAGSNQVLLALQRLLQPALTTVDSLNIFSRSLHSADLDTFASVVREVAPQLQSLMLNITRGMLNPHLAFDFPRLHSLRSMKIIIDEELFHEPDWNLYIDNMERVICRLVTCIPATARVLALELRLLNIKRRYHADYARGQEDEIDWIPIDPPIKRMVFEIVHNNFSAAADVWQKGVIDSLSKVHVIGLLQFKIPTTHQWSADSDFAAGIVTIKGIANLG
ncbi:hypothetical protein QCA50_010611 [Cerrena zonata]|uniref:F-box domain-containing protein n=1 Tax=Cerrena zonata TaxID=2478898 RepID=A0AAW0G4E5_9APHY